jgi:hypothetical protein
VPNPGQVYFVLGLRGNPQIPITIIGRQGMEKIITIYHEVAGIFLNLSINIISIRNNFVF